VLRLPHICAIVDQCEYTGALRFQNIHSHIPLIRNSNVQTHAKTLEAHPLLIVVFSPREFVIASFDGQMSIEGCDTYRPFFLPISKKKIPFIPSFHCEKILEEINLRNFHRTKKKHPNKKNACPSNLVLILKIPAS